MDAIVVLAVAIALAAVAAVFLAVGQVRKAVRSLGAGAGAAGDRVRPLTEDLRSELAVVAIELDALGASAARLKAARSRGRHGGEATEAEAASYPSTGLRR